MITVKKDNQVYKIDEKYKDYYVNRGFAIVEENEGETPKAKGNSGKPNEAAKGGGGDDDKKGGDSVTDAVG
jgi:hypothetical protein